MSVEPQPPRCLPLEMNFWAQQKRGVDAFIGGGCNRVREYISLLAGKSKLPVISWGCMSAHLSNRNTFPTFVRTVELGLPLPSESTPMEIVAFLIDWYIVLDNILRNYDVFKLETIGDCLLVVSGLPVRNGNRHAGEIVDMAFDILSLMTHFKIRHRPRMELQLRIGLHSVNHVIRSQSLLCVIVVNCSCVAGEVGIHMPRFCLFGDTVNVASRVETTGQGNCIPNSPLIQSQSDEKLGENSEKSKMVRICGPKLANCCFLISIWGVIMLLLLGVFFSTRSVALIEDIPGKMTESEGYKSSAKNCYIAAGIYAVTMVVAAHQKWVNSRTGDTQKLYVQA
ncbi:Guanylate cyclase 32E [Stylophora pistillata]|uniref:Guanylate cyclase 32E n=2 Tax=Stylophora pistillata TaxID=50429 RepID=A0A2B4RY46_STYPI|nr:Guanylate cyclase 32E [Stylophora pistillata]